MSEFAVVMENVTKKYFMGNYEICALQNISLRIKKGIFLSVIGPSGSGKSTLLHLIGALDTPTQGKIVVEGVELTCVDERTLELQRLKTVGFVFQAFNLIPTLTAIENIELPLSFADLPPKNQTTRAKYLLNLVGLEKRAIHRPSELSCGEQQRLAIARALANDPALILADEPTGNLDSNTGTKIIKILRNLSNNGKTVILATHDPKIINFSDKIVYLEDGKIVGDTDGARS